MQGDPPKETNIVIEKDDLRLDGASKIGPVSLPQEGPPRQTVGSSTIMVATQLENLLEQF